MKKRLCQLVCLGALMATAACADWPDEWDADAPMAGDEAGADVAVELAPDALCQLPADTSCVPFSVDAAGTASDLDALRCSLELLDSGEDGVIFVDADGAEGQWAWDWEIHIVDGAISVLRRGPMIGEDGELHSMVRVLSCDLADAAMFDGAMSALDEASYGEPIATALPTEWLGSCDIVDELACD
jgi:hypothetical protein